MLTVRPLIGRFAPRSRRILVCAAVALLSLVGCASASALNLTGVWSANYHCETGPCPGGPGSNFPATDTLIQTGEAVTGENGTETITGTVTGNTFVYESSTGGYKAKGTLTVAADGLSFSGPSEDSNGTKGTYTATRNLPPPGSLSQLASPFNCVGEEGFHQPEIGCGTLLPPGAIKNSYEAQVSSDGRFVYSVAVEGDLIEYERNLADGALTAIGCITASSEQCASENVTTNALEMKGPQALAISPEGKSVYVVTFDDVLVQFERNPGTGLLTEKSCIGYEADSACEVKGAKGLNEPYGVTVSHNGKNVYVASNADGAVAEFSRNAETGALEQLASPNDCISSSALSKCGTIVSGHELERAIGVVESPDERNVYVAAGATAGEGAIAVLERDDLEEGALKLLPTTEACVSEALAECTHGVEINGPEDLVISPDGKNVYANSFKDNAVLEFQRESSGALVQLPSPNACVMNAPAVAACTQGKGLKETLGVAISPDGENVYASSWEEDDEAAFSRDGETGVLTQLPSPYECVGKVVFTTCDTTGIAGIAGARRVTVSPDGMNLYVAGQDDHSLVELARAVKPTVTSVGSASGSEAGGTKVEIKGSGFIAGAMVHFGANAATSVTVHSATSITATSPAGRGTVDVTVTSRSGTSAVTAGDRFTYELPGTSTCPCAPPNLIFFNMGVPPVVPPPVLARTGNVAPVSGTVLVKLPGTTTFVPLSSLRQIPFGSVIDATNGTVSVTTAVPGGKTQTGQFFSGEFILRQGPNGLVVAELTGGNFSVCPTKRERSHIARAASVRAQAAASGKHVVRKLWANAHGKFSTKGNYAAGAVQGTEWLTEDLCEGTLIRVTRDKVAVTNLVNHRHVEVKKGHKYLAKAPRG